MKRAREQNVESAAGQQGETAHHDTTTGSPDRKKPRRAGRAEDDDEEGGLEWNLLRDLPYVAFRRLLDFLSVNSGGAFGNLVIGRKLVIDLVFGLNWNRGLVECCLAWGAGAMPRARRKRAVRGRAHLGRRPASGRRGGLRAEDGGPGKAAALPAALVRNSLTVPCRVVCCA